MILNPQEQCDPCGPPRVVVQNPCDPCNAPPVNFDCETLVQERVVEKPIYKEKVVYVERIIHKPVKNIIKVQVPRKVFKKRCVPVET